MASPNSYILNQYKNKVGWFVKAYEPASTTVKEIYFEVQELTGSFKLQINSEGFIENPYTNKSAILYLGGDFDMYMFETEAEADANDFTNASKIADNVTADKDSAALNIPNADETNYGLVKLATQGEAEATSPVDENLATTPFKLDIIAVDNMASYVASPAEVLAKAPNKTMTAADYPNLAALYAPAAPSKDFIIGQTYWRHPDNVTADFLLQDNATFDPNIRPLGTLPDYKQGDGTPTGVTQGTKNQFLAVNTNVEGAPLKFLQIEPKRWFGIIQYNGINYFCESDNQVFWNIYTGNALDAAIDIAECSLAYNPNDKVFAVLNNAGNSFYSTTAYLNNTGIDFTIDYNLWFVTDPTDPDLIRTVSFDYNEELQLFVLMYYAELDFGFNEVEYTTTDDFLTEINPINLVNGSNYTMPSNNSVTKIDLQSQCYHDGNYYILGKFDSDITLIKIPDDGIRTEPSEDLGVTISLTPTTNYSDLYINEDGILTTVIGYDSPTGRFEILTADLTLATPIFSTVIVDTGFTSMTADAYCIPVKNYWLLKTGDNINSAYTKDFVTIDLETNYTGEGSHLNMFASYIEGTDKFVEYTSAGSVDGHMYRLENEATIDWAYKTIKMMGAPDAGGKSITGWNNPVATQEYNTGGSGRQMIYVKLSDTLFYGLAYETVTDGGAYNVIKTTDAGDSWTTLTQASTGAYSKGVSNTKLAWDGGDYILFTSEGSTVSVFRISTETFTTLNYNMFFGSPQIGGAGHICHWNENLGKFITFNFRDDSETLYIAQFVNDPTVKTTEVKVITGTRFDYTQGSSTTESWGYYNGNYYIYDIENADLYSVDENTWVFTLVHSFTPSLATTYAGGQLYPLKVYFNSNNEMAFVLSWDATTKQVEVAYSTDMSTYQQKTITLPANSNIASTPFVTPVFDSWGMHSSNDKNTVITKDFTSIIYSKDDWVASEGNIFHFSDWDNVNNVLREYTTSNGLLPNSNIIYRNTIDAIVDITAADPDYVDRSTPYLVPVVYAPII